MRVRRSCCRAAGEAAERRNLGDPHWPVHPDERGEKSPEGHAETSAFSLFTPGCITLDLTPSLPSPALRRQASDRLPG